eukprot:3390484-Rhodomonas_salina.3
MVLPGTSQHGKGCRAHCRDTNNPILCTSYSISLIVLRRCLVLRYDMPVPKVFKTVPVERIVEKAVPQVTSALRFCACCAMRGTDAVKI